VNTITAARGWTTTRNINIPDSSDTQVYQLYLQEVREILKRAIKYSMAASQEPALPPSGAAKEAEMSEMGVDKMRDTPGPHSGIKVSRRLSSQF
jgi:hypothetical protein